MGRSRGDRPCGRRVRGLSFDDASDPLPYLGNPSRKFCLGSLSDLQGQLYEEGRGGWSQHGFGSVEFGGVGFWLECDLHVGGASLGGGRIGVVGGEKRERSFPESRFLNRADGATA
jgi:hypothetical protein